MDGQQQIKRQPATGGTFARFNMRAFIFNSFYYFYHGIRSDRFWLFFSATPVLPSLPPQPPPFWRCVSSPLFALTETFSGNGKKTHIRQKKHQLPGFPFPSPECCFFPSSPLTSIRFIWLTKTGRPSATATGNIISRRFFAAGSSASFSSFPFFCG